MFLLSVNQIACFFVFVLFWGFLGGGRVTLYPYNLFEMFELEAYSFHNYDELITPGRSFFKLKMGLIFSFSF